MKSHEYWMRVALEEAEKGKGLTAPNPAVGAVIVKGDEILGKGFHSKAGAPHAEREAIADALSRHKALEIEGSSIYVTLEPCSTVGKTSACTEAIFLAGISEVIYGSTDKNPLHAGAADAYLNKKGIKVVSGVLEEDCDALIMDFSKRIMTGLPWVIAKTAMSLDGKITRPSGESQWLTSEQSREIVHELRSKVDAIIIGGRTLRKDNPRLSVRLEKNNKFFKESKLQPFRVVITHEGRSQLPEDLHVFSDENKDRTIVYQDWSFINILKNLAQRGCNAVLLECGGGLMGQWFDQNLVDECHFFLAPMVTGSEDLAVGGQGVISNTAAIVLENIQYKKIGDDVLASGIVAKNI